MKYLKNIVFIIIIGFYFAAACSPKGADQEDREAMKNDSIDMTEGKGEGDIGIGDKGGQAL